MSELTANPNYSWDETLRELKHDDGSDRTLDFVDIIGQELLDKSKWLYTNKTFAVKAQFDASAGAAIGAHGLGVTIPGNAIIVRTFYDVLDTFTSAGDLATIALHAEAADDIIAAVAIGAATDWDAGLHDGLQDGTMANAIKITADDVSIAGEVVGAGDGTEVDFAHTLFGAQLGPIVPSSITVDTTDPYQLTDNGAGVLNGGDGDGTVDYVTGEMAMTFDTAPADEAAITVDYDYTPNPGPGRELTATVAVEDLTAGKLNLFVEYVISDLV